jgi:hypothetical protein
MRFDEFWGDDAEPKDLPLVPDGRHAGEIVDAKAKSLKFMERDNNPQGLSLVIVIVVKGCQQLEAIIPVHMRGKVEAVAKAAGVPLPAVGQEWDERQLIGRQVLIETALAVSPKSGREYVQIKSWHRSPVDPAVAATKPAARRGSASKPASNDPDDIPF